MTQGCINRQKQPPNQTKQTDKTQSAHVWSSHSAWEGPEARASITTPGPCWAFKCAPADCRMRHWRSSRPLLNWSSSQSLPAFILQIEFFPTTWERVSLHISVSLELTLQIRLKLRGLELKACTTLPVTNWILIKALNLEYFSFGSSTVVYFELETNLAALRACLLAALTSQSTVMMSFDFLQHWLKFLPGTERQQHSLLGIYYTGIITRNTFTGTGYVSSRIMLTGWCFKNNTFHSLL